ncbi:nuclear pore complex protein Nup214-like [Maniola jurtina]|uniref:nuclear pore complex protein Nup214-like n=1 Tax=Maniola jurtina TaxID=191418 RepID=UPI001E687836|nr:nuclear pore complex protein Nup214-like [Maniola jurtina]
MEVQFGPNSIDEPSLLYKLQRKIKVFNTNQPLPNRGYNLVACTSKYGLVFVATPIKTLSVYYLKELIDKECEPQHLLVKLQVSPSHIAVNCNEEWLAVVGGQMLLVYKCMDFQNMEIRPAVSIKCDVSPSTFVSALQWNPCIPDTIGIVFFDGTLLVSQVSTMQMKKIQSNARCLCWSPKGKQLVTGNNDGTLSQFKPDLSPMKMVPTPNLFEGSPVEVLAIYWIATYQFAVAYRNAVDNSRPAVTIVNTPKGGQPVCHNYEDICYSMGSNRPWYYYLQGLAQWNIILSSSSNSMEIATLASPDGANWVQWCQSDEARPELPLTDKKQENYPVGICLDTAAIHQLPWGENETLPPMPLLHVVSQTGLLSIFNIINLNKSAPQICAPIQPIALPAAALTINIPDDVPPQPAAPPAAPVAQPKPQPPQVQYQPPVQAPQVAPVPVQQPIPVVPKPVPQPQSNVGLSTASSIRFGVIKEPTPPAAPEAPSPAPQPKPPVQAPKSQAAAAAEASAALLEQEKINKAKMNQKLKSMLVKEVNDFNMDMYKFIKHTQEKLLKFQQDIESANLRIDIDMDPELLRKDCSVEELRETVVQLKLEMVRACAVIAEARTYANANELQEWTQADPLTVKRIASVKKLAYYVETQLDHARKALDLKWNEMYENHEYRGKPGYRMMRPILDDVYQPLVKQQEILSRQMTVLKMLRKTMDDCNIAPMYRSSLIRSTPFRNKDTLSKLTKNILNMSIEPQEKPKEHLLSSQKLDALRDILSNHKPIKVKPVNVELRQHLESMKLRYEKSVKEKEMREVEIKQEMGQPNIQKPVPISVTPAQPHLPTARIAQPIPAPVPQPTRLQQDMPQLKSELKKDSNVFMGQKFGAPTAFAYTQPFISSVPKPDIVKESPINIPTYTPVSNIKPAVVTKQPASVVRTLFTDDKEKPTGPEDPQSQQQPTIDEQPKQFNPNINPYTKSQLRKFILKDSSNENVPQANEPKSDANTFMGQNICSPTAFAFAKPNASAPTAIFGSKPADVTNTSNKTAPESIPTVTSTVNPKSSETGEPEAGTPSNDENKPKEEKPITNMFTLKTTQFSGKSQNVPDVLKSSGQGFVFGKVDSKATEGSDKPKESSSVKASGTQEKPTTDNRKEEIKPVAQMINKPPAQAVIYVDLKKPAAEAKVEKVASSLFDVSTAAPPPAGSKLQSEVGPTTTQQSSVFEVSKPVAQASSTKVATSEPTSTPTTEPNASVATPTSIPTVTTTSTSKPLTLASDTETTPTVTISIPSKPSEAENVTNKEHNVPTESSATKDSPSVTTSNVFSSTGSIFAPTATSDSPSTLTTEDSKPSIFNTPTPTSVFESNTAFVSTQPSAFASNASSIFASASASAFGPQTTKAPLFSPSTTSQSIFGTPSVTTTSVFGNAPSAQSIFSSASSSIFGGTPTTTQNIFGTSTTQASVFGSGQSVFGTSGSPNQVFGTPATQTSIFGSPTSTTHASVFGSPTQTTQASVFGSPTPATQASVFGSPTTTQSSLFGGAESNLFASATISTTSAPTQASGGNIFGGGSSGTVFGNSTNIFSGKSTFSGSNPTAASIFGGGTPFGQKPANDFWSGGSNTGFGNSAFGQAATTQASSIFGSSGGSFSTPSPGQPFGSPQGPFSGGDSKPSVFGTPPQQQPASAFGGSAAFGSKPVFGGSPTFGSTAFGGFNKSPSSGFGAPAAFGGGAFGGSSFGNTSPGKGFGTAAPSFGPPTQSNATFENLATQNTLTFGNLAQQSGQPPQPTPGFNTSPSFTGWRG